MDRGRAGTLALAAGQTTGNDSTWTGSHMGFCAYFSCGGQNQGLLTIGYNHPKYFVYAKIRGYKPQR